MTIYAEIIRQQESIDILDSGIGHYDRMEWYPFDTAPTDGTKVLVTYHPANGSSLPIKIAYMGTVKSNGKNYRRWKVSSSHRLRFKPTHWMPLPGAPL